MKTEFDSLCILTTTPGFNNSGGQQASEYGHQNWIHDSEGIQKQRQQNEEAHGQGIEKTMSKLPGVTYFSRSKLRFELEMLYAREAH